MSKTQTETKTVEHTLPDGQQVTATFHRATGWDTLNRDRLVRKLREADAAVDMEADPAYFHHVSGWAEVMMQMDAIEGIDFTRPSPVDAPEDVLAAFHAWYCLDGPLVWTCRRAVIELNAPPGERELAPLHNLTPDERADPKSAPGE